MNDETREALMAYTRRLVAMMGGECEERRERTPQPYEGTADEVEEDEFFRLLRLRGLSEGPDDRFDFDGGCTATVKERDLTYHWNIRTGYVWATTNTLDAVYQDGDAADVNEFEDFVDEINRDYNRNIDSYSRW